MLNNYNYIYYKVRCLCELIDMLFWAGMIHDVSLKVHLMEKKLKTIGNHHLFIDNHIVSLVYN